MPCYDYICPKCKERFEAICNRDAKDKIHCSKCQTLAERIITKGASYRIIGYCYANENPRKENWGN